MINIIIIKKIIINIIIIIIIIVIWDSLGYYEISQMSFFV